jgi:hypothetical protein
MDVMGGCQCRYRLFGDHVKILKINPNKKTQKYYKNKIILKLNCKNIKKIIIQFLSLT